ncbi:MAG: hypothetical protein ROO73_06300 [Roseivirga sp.]
MKKNILKLLPVLVIGSFMTLMACDPKDKEDPDSPDHQDPSPGPGQDGKETPNKDKMTALHSAGRAARAGADSATFTNDASKKLVALWTAVHTEWAKAGGPYSGSPTDPLPNAKTTIEEVAPMLDAFLDADLSSDFDENAAKAKMKEFKDKKELSVIKAAVEGLLKLVRPIRCEDESAPNWTIVVGEEVGGFTAKNAVLITKDDMYTLSNQYPKHQDDDANSAIGDATGTDPDATERAAGGLGNGNGSKGGDNIGFQIVFKRAQLLQAYLEALEAFAQ